MAAGAGVIALVFFFASQRGGGSRAASPPGRTYGMMIDAGSTGSRVHTFIFDRDASGQLKLDSEDFFAVKPGLSEYKDDPAQASASIEQLLARSREVIPKDHHAAAPVFLRATAGLRATGPEASARILSEVRGTLRRSGFRFDKDDWVSILDGKDEGIFSWITVNYMLKTPPTETVGTLEMGGGSAQVAFVPRQAPAQGCAVPAEHLTYKGTDLSLYTISHQGYGIKYAMETVMSTMGQNATLAQANPCLAAGEQTVTTPQRKTFEMQGAGNFRQCVSEIAGILSKGSGACSCGLCTYGGSPQPHPINSYVAFAFYKERTVDLGLRSPVSMQDIAAKGEQVCGSSLAKLNEQFQGVANGSPADLCFDLAFMYANLRDGHGLTEAGGAKLQIVSKIDGVELGWSLGAMLKEFEALRMA